MSTLILASLILLLVVALCPLVVILLLEPALRCADGGDRRPHMVALTVIAWLADIVVAHTSWALVTGFPRKGEWTISHTLERLCVTDGPHQQDYIALAKWINKKSPTGAHIKAVAGF